MNSASAAIGIDASEVIRAAQALQNSGNAINAGLKAGGEQATKLILSAMKMGSSSVAKSLEQGALFYSSEIDKAHKKVNDIEKAIQQLDEDKQRQLTDSRYRTDKKARQELEQTYKKNRDVLVQALKNERLAAEDTANTMSRAFEKSSARDIKRIEEEAEMLKSINEDAAKLNRTVFKEFTTGFSEAVTGSLSGIDVGNISSALFKGINLGADKVSKMALTRKVAKAEKGEEVGVLLQTLTKMGPVVAGLTAVMAGFVAVAVAAVGQTKEFNKKILDGSTALDLFGKNALESSFDLKSGLDSIRSAVGEVSSITNLAHEEVYELVNAFNSTSVPINKFIGAFSKTNDMFEATVEMAMFASTYSRVFGVAASDVVGQFNVMFKDMGMGLDQVKDAFGDIASAAHLTNMSVKDFFTSISALTSGLALYNLRLLDTTKLLAGMSKIVGKEKAQELIGSQGEMASKDIGERYKASMLVGKSGQKIYEADLKRQVKAYGETFGNEYNSIVGKYLEKPMQLAKMSAVEFSKLQQQILDTGGVTAEAAASNLKAIRMSAMGATGKTMGMAAGMSGLAGLSDLAVRAAQGFKFTSQKNLGDMGFIDRKVFEEQSGISGKDFDTLADIMARYKALAGENKTNQEVLEMMAGGEMPLSEKDRKTLEEIGTKPPETMEGLAKRQIDSTTDLGTILKNIIAKILNGIGTTLQDIYDFLMNIQIPGVSSARERRDQRFVQTKAKEKAAERIETLDAMISEAKGALGRETSKSEVLRNQELINLKEQEIKELEASRAEALASKEKAEKNLETLRSGGSLTTEVEVKTGSGNALANAGTGLGVLAADWVSNNITGEKVNYTAELVNLEEQRALKEEQRKQEEEKIAKADSIELKNISEILDQQKAFDELTKKYGEAAVEAKFSGDTTALRRLIDNNPYGLAALRAAGLEDFIYRGDGVRGTIQSINKKDEFFGAKPGGAIDKAMNGGRGSVNVNIYGGDEAKIYNVVKRAIKESGL